MGKSLEPLLASLSGSAVSGSSGLSERKRDPSPEALRLAAAIEEARRDSLKLEEQRSTILEKVEKLEKKKAKQQQKQQQQHIL